MNRRINLLRIFAALELASLAVLLSNLATGNSQAVAAAVGPIHGAFYLCVIITVARHPGTTLRTTALSIVPAIGGLLALRRISRGTRSYGSVEG